MNTSLGRKSSSSILPFNAQQRERVRGFTLLELLVVITIIIILIGMLFPAFRGIQDQAKRTQAKNDLSQIVAAISAFYTEYGRYPLPTTATTDTAATYSATNNVVFDILRYDITRDPTTVNALNPRQIVFITPPIAKDQTTPKLGVQTSSGVWFDPWGYAYNVTIDANYNAVTTQTPPYTDLSPTYTQAGSDLGPKTGAISWTKGPDNQLGNAGDNQYKNTSTGIQSDDVISWQ
jgi:prepilin-type N-terminal cleavage/methylation domain-containing protein